MQAMTGGRLKPALVVMLVAAYTVGGFALVLTTGHSSHLACNPSIPLPSRGIINLPPIVCHQQVEWGSLLLGVAGGALLGGLLAVVIMAIARIRNPV